MRSSSLVSCVFLLFGFGVAAVSAQEHRGVSIKVGDRICVSMKGAFAKKYQELIQAHLVTNEFTLKGHGPRVVQVLKNNRYQIEDLIEVSEIGRQPYLVTWTTMIDASELKPSFRDSDPNDLETALALQDLGPGVTSHPRLEVSDLKLVKLRIWKLERDLSE